MQHPRMNRSGIRVREVNVQVLSQATKRETMPGPGEEKPNLNLVVTKLNIK